MSKSNKQIKLKPANKIAQEQKVKETQEQKEDISSSITPMPNEPDSPDEQEEDTDVMIPQCQPNSEPPDVPSVIELPEDLKDVSLGEVETKNFFSQLETFFISLLDKREAKRKAEQEARIKANEEAGIDTITDENALVKCTEYMNAIFTNYDMFKNHQGAVYENIKNLYGITKCLHTIVGRIEKTQGVKAPRRPPFPSWACLAYLFWHWPMYGFSYLWLSKYFRRFCFLITFFVMILQFCLIVLLASDNKTMNYERNKYITVRNWSVVMEDTAAINRFNHVDLLYEDVDFNREQIHDLNAKIKAKHENMMQDKLHGRRK